MHARTGVVKCARWEAGRSVDQGEKLLVDNLRHRGGGGERGSKKNSSEGGGADPRMLGPRGTRGH